jgi:hypothetical protein
MRRSLKVMLVALILCMVPIFLRAEIPVGVDAEVSGVSKYIWRGMEVNEDFVIQPSITASVGPVSFNVWGNMDTTDYGKEAGYGDKAGEFTEIDLTLDYTFSYKIASFDVGVINYTFPNSVGESTYEGYLSVGLDTILSPTLSLYYDFDEINGFYGNFAISHSFKLSDIVSLDLSSSIGYGSSNFNDGYFGDDSAGFVDFNIGASLPFTVGKYVTISPYMNFSSIVDDDLRDAKAYDDNDNLIVGLTISASF